MLVGRKGLSSQLTRFGSAAARVAKGGYCIGFWEKEREMREAEHAERDTRRMWKEEIRLLETSMDDRCLGMST